MKTIKNQSGQGLVEYLILVALMAVATVGIVRVLNQTVNAQFTNVVFGLQGKNTTKAQTETPDDSLYKKKDLSDFMNGAVSRAKE